MQSYAELQKLTQEACQPDHAKLIPPRKLKEDLDFLFKTIEEVHPNMYAYTSKEEFDPLREKLYESIEHPMNRLEFYKLAAPVVAALKNGHTLLQPPYLQEFLRYYKGGGQVFPHAPPLDKYDFDHTDSATAESSHLPESHNVP